MDCQWEAVAAITITELSALRSLHRLKELPKRPLTQVGIQVVLSDASKRLADDKKSYLLLNQCIDHLFPYATFTSHLLPPNSQIEDWYTGERVATWHRRLDSLGNAIATTVAHFARAQKEKHSTAEDLPFAKQLVTIVLETEILHAAYQVAAYPPFIHLSKRVADILDDGRLWGDNDIRLYEVDSPKGASAGTENMAGRALPWAFARAAAQHLAGLVYSDLPVGLVTATDKLLVDSYTDYRLENLKRTRGKGYPTQCDIIQEFSGWLKAPWRNAREPRALAEETLRVLRGNVTSNLDDNVRHTIWTDMVHNLVSTFISDFSSGAVSQFDRIPWDELAPNQLQRVLALVGEELLPEVVEWDVVLVVGNLDSEHGIFEANKCVFYDPETWRFAEGLSNSPSSPVQKNIAHARVPVTARTAYQGAYLARNKVAAALDLLASPESQDEFSIAAPEVTRSFVAICKADGIGESGWERFPVPEEGILRVSQHDLIARGRFFNTFFKRLDPTKDGQLENALIRIDHWYRMARFQRSDVGQFLYLWISLEHITSGDTHINPARIFRIISALRMTWAERFDILILPIQDAMNAILDFLDSNEDIRLAVESEPKFVDWKSNRVLLDFRFLNRLKPLVGDQKVTHAIDTLIEMLARPDKARQIANVVALQQEECWLTLSMLNRRRNQIVHTALTSEADLRIYCETLQEIVQWVAVKIHNALMATPPLSSIEEVINLYQEPFMKWSPRHDKLVRT